MRLEIHFMKPYDAVPDRRYTLVTLRRKRRKRFFSLRSWFEYTEVVWDGDGNTPYIYWPGDLDGRRPRHLEEEFVQALKRFRKKEQMELESDAGRWVRRDAIPQARLIEGA